MYKTWIYNTSLVQNSYVQHLICTTPWIHNTWIYNTWIYNTLNIQHIEYKIAQWPIINPRAPLLELYFLLIVCSCVYVKRVFFSIVAPSIIDILGATIEKKHAVQGFSWTYQSLKGGPLGKFWALSCPPIYMLYIQMLYIQVLYIQVLYIQGVVYSRCCISKLLYIHMLYIQGVVHSYIVQTRCCTSLVVHSYVVHHLLYIQGVVQMR